MSKLRYLLRCIERWWSAEAHFCCNCGSGNSSVTDRKYLITALRRCHECSVLFRTPTDNQLDALRYYEQEYAQGFTTALPDDEMLGHLRRSAFAGTEKDYAAQIRVLRSCGLQRGDRLFDFGCSWGYGSYQLTRAGFDVLAFELSPTRRAYAAGKLGVQTVDSTAEITNGQSHAGAFDCFFSSHVLEHVSNVQAVIELASHLLKPGGLFVSFTPNGSARSRAVNANWSQLWGEVHPLMIDDVFLDRAFAAWPRLFASSSYAGAVFSLPGAPDAAVLDDLGGDELLFVARKPGGD